MVPRWAMSPSLAAAAGALLKNDVAKAAQEVETGYGSHISASVGFRYFIPEFMRQVAKAMNVFIF